MASKKYKQLNIDGVLGDVYDDEAVHNEEVVEVVLQVLADPTIRAALLDMYHPIGSYYFTDRDINPGTFLGGTWATVEGRVLLGASAKYPVNSTGGYTDATLPAHNHSATGSTSGAGNHSHSFSGTAAAAGAHAHSFQYASYDRATGSYVASALQYGGYTKNTSTAGTHTHSVSGSTSVMGNHTHAVSVSVADSGSDSKDKNMMPYKAAYIWVRTA